MSRTRLVCCLCAACLVFSIAPGVPAQEPEGVVVSVRTDRPEAVYKCNEEAAFTVTVTDGGKPVTEGEVVVTVKRDFREQVERKTLTLGKEPVKVTGTLAKPGFLSCEAAYTKDAKVTKGMAGAGFDPTGIQTACTLPADFDAFWKAGREELAKVPMDAQLTPLAADSDAEQDAFKISFANVGGTRIYGFLSVPKGKKGPFPVLLNFPSAGAVKPTKPTPWYGRMGVIYLDMCIRDFDPTNIPPDLDKRTSYVVAGAPDREKYDFRRIILGLDRAVDYMVSRPDFDGKHVMVMGGSQGGGLALIIAGLDERVTAAWAGVPALCDQQADLADRQATWPNLLMSGQHRTPEWISMVPYFDGVNFARRIKCPTVVGVGFLDTTCPPASVYAAYNVIRAPKYIFNGPLSGHGEPQAMAKFQMTWLRGQLGLGPVVPFPEEKK